MYNIFSDILLLNYKNELFQYIIKDNELRFVAKIHFEGKINSITCLKNNSLLVGGGKNVFFYSYINSMNNNFN